jgi:hypothetical protein
MNTSFPRGMMLAAVALMAGAIACSDLGSEPTIDDLDVQYLSGAIVADMMPVIPPVPGDRIFCFIDLVVHNSSATRLDVTFRVMQAELRRSGTRARLGTLYFSTSWDGVLEPYATDTVRLLKRELSDDFHQPECDASVECDLEIGEAENLLIRLTTDSMTFNCVY